MNQASTVLTSDPFAQINALNASGANLSSQISELLVVITALQSQLNSLSAQKTSLEGQLQKAEQDGDVQTADNIKKQLEACTNEIAHVSAELTGDQAAYAQKQGQLLSFSSTSDGLQFANEILKSGPGVSNEHIETETPPPPQPAIDEANQEALKSINEYINLSVELSNTIIETMDTINKKQKEVDEKEARIEELESLIVEYSIKAAVYCACIFTAGKGASYAKKAVEATNEKNKLQGEVDQLKNEINELKAKLEADMNKLAGMNAGNLSGEIQKLKDLVGQILKILGSAPGGEISEGQMQEVAALVVQVLALVQTILTQVQSQRTEDQQWMSRGAAAGLDVSVNEAKVNLKKFIAALDHAGFMKTVMNIVKYTLLTVSVLAAVVTGGTGAILIAVAMAALTLYGEEATNDLAKSMDSDGSGWSKALASAIVVIVTIALVAATCGAASLYIASRAGTAAAQQVANQAAQKASTEAVEASANAAANAAKEVAEETAEEVGEQAVQKVVQEGAKSTVDDVAAQAATTASSSSSSGATATTTTRFQSFKNHVTLNGQMSYGYTASTFFFANNGLVNTSQMIAEMFKSKDELKEDKVYQIMQIVIGAIQAIMAMLIGSKMIGQTAGGSGSLSGNPSSAAAKIREFLQLPRSELIRVLNGIQLVGTGISVMANLGMARTKHDLANSLEAMGDANYKMAINKEILESIDGDQKAASEWFAVFLQQQMKALEETTRRMGAAEREMAHVLETAV